MIWEGVKYFQVVVKMKMHTMRTTKLAVFNLRIIEEFHKKSANISIVTFANPTHCECTSSGLSLFSFHVNYPVTDLDIAGLLIERTQQNAVLFHKMFANFDAISIRKTMLTRVGGVVD